jgi:hypothetical protein
MWKRELACDVSVVGVSSAVSGVSLDSRLTVFVLGIRGAGYTVCYHGRGKFVQGSSGTRPR